MNTLIQPIEDICFKFDCNLERRIIHKNTLLKIKDYLDKCGFKTILEYPIDFNYLKRKEHKIQRRHGYIDLIGINNQIKIAIELDSGTHVKFKSIEKLVETNFDILIAIVKGKSEYNKLVEENINKIKSINNTSSKKILLILMENKISTYVN